MAIVFDEISLEYWEAHKKQVGSSKSYACEHKGHVYGDQMSFEEIEYVYKADGIEEKHAGIQNGPKWAYFDFVQSACNRSAVTLNNCLTNPAEKFRIYTEEQVSQFTTTKRNSTRIRDESCKILVSGKPYYVANNLKICEYFNSAAMNIDPEEKKSWFIRIYVEGDTTQQMMDRDEEEVVEFNNLTYTITMTSPNRATRRTRSQNRSVESETIVNIDYDALNRIRKTIGDLGEDIVYDYEKQRLIALGKQELAERIEHTSKERGDGFGYDIVSFEEDGSPLFIEVKTTKQNKAADFYISRNEYLVGNQMLAEGKRYRIYRLYRLNTTTGKGDLAIYEPPFDNEHYDMQPESWRIQLIET